MKFAEETKVSAEKSRADIERTIHRYGASQYMYGWKDSGTAIIMFTMLSRQIKFVVKMPVEADFKTSDAGRSRKREPQIAAWEKACRQKWRALYLVIKAKLEAVESDISVFEDEFMAHIVLPDGKTVSEFMRPQIAVAYDRGTMPNLLPHLRDD